MTLHLYVRLGAFFFVGGIEGVTNRCRERVGGVEREITIICDSLVECIWAYWQTAEAVRNKKLGGAAESE